MPTTREVLDAVLANVADGITAVDGAGRIVFANQAAAEAVGAASPEEMIRDPSSIVARFDMVDDSGAPFPVEKLPNRLSFRDAEPHEAVIGWRPKGHGEMRWNHVRSVPVKNPDGTVRLVVSVSRDISAARRREASDRLLSRASDLLARSLDVETTVAQIARLAVPGLSDWVVVDVVDEPGARPRRIATAHADPAKLELAKDLDRRWPPIWVPDAPMGVPAVLRTGRAEMLSEVPTELIEKAARDPEHLEVIRSLALTSYMCVPLPAHGGQVLGALTLIATFGSRAYGPEDLAFATELGRRAGVALENARLFRESQDQAARAKLIAEAARAFSLVGNDPKIVIQEVVELLARVMRDACSLRILSDDRESLVAAGMHHVDPASSATNEAGAQAVPASDGVLGEVVRTGNAALISHVTAEALGFKDANLQSLSQKYRFHSLMVAPLRSHGIIYGTLAVSRDRTPEPFTAADLATLEDLADRAALAIENARLIAGSESANRQKDDFIAMLAHELRNPMAPMFNATHLLGMPDVPAKTLDRAREVLDRQLRHLSRLVDDLLDVSRISRGKIELRREAFAVCDLIREVASDRIDTFAAAGIRLEILCETGGHVFADRTRIAQVVGNLLNNALKFTSRDGTVVVRAGTDPATKRAWVSVGDTGIGIERARLGDVFDAFVQEQSTLDRSRGGLGLGLAVVKGIVALHGGGVSAHSDGAGKGAEFRFWLPLERGVLEPAPPPSTTRVAGSRRILVVDDNVDLAETVATILETAGHVVETETSGSNTLARIRTMMPEIVLCDIGLPGKDGYEIAKEVSADPSLASVRLVAVSGYGMASDKERALASGFAQHLTKPVEPSALYALLASL